MKANVEAFRLLEIKKNLSPSQVAELMGIHRSQYWRVTNGKANAGGKFIEKFKSAFPKLKIDQYFFSTSVA